MLAAANVVEDDDAVVVEIDGVDEDVDDALAERRIAGIAFADVAEPRADFRLGDADFLRDAKMGEVGFCVGFLRLKKLHLFVDALMRNLGRVHQSIDEGIQIAVDTTDDALKLGGFAVVELLIVFGGDSLGDGSGAGGREDVL